MDARKEPQVDFCQGSVQVHVAMLEAQDHNRRADRGLMYEGG